MNLINNAKKEGLKPLAIKEKYHFIPKKYLDRVYYKNIIKARIINLINRYLFFID